MTYCLPFQAPQYSHLTPSTRRLRPILSTRSSTGSQQALGHQLHGDRRLHADQRRRPPRGEIGHQLHVDAVPRNRFDLELEAGRVLLRPLVHGGDRDAAVGSGLAPHAHGAGLGALRECAAGAGEPRRGRNAGGCHAGQQLPSIDGEPRYLPGMFDGHCSPP